MSSIRRRINSTGRKRIPHERVRADVMDPKPASPLQAKLTLNLEGLGFPSSGKVVFEAYQKPTAMRFDLGTVAAPEIPGVFELVDLDPGAAVLFRLKVITADDESGRILGAAERLRPASDDNEDGRRSLFPIDKRDLGSEIWKVEIGDAGPRLLINYSVPGLIERIQTDPLVQGLLLPAALRVVLVELAGNPAADDDDTSWKADWLRFCREELRLAEDPSDIDDDGREAWIDEGVRSFCTIGEFLPKVRASIQGGTGASQKAQ